VSEREREAMKEKERRNSAKRETLK